jgi:hypothetical protein
LLQAGESKTVYFGMSARDFTLVGSDGDRYVGKGAWTVRVGDLAIGSCL